MKEINEALDQTIESLEKIIEYDHQLPLNYTRDMWQHIELIIIALRRLSPIDGELECDKPKTVIEKIGIYASWIKSYSKEIIEK